VPNKALIARLAPAAPPCFAGQRQWTEYLVASVAARKEGDAQGPVIQGPDGAPSFNADFFFCRDCSPHHSFDMAHQGRCKPNFLRDKFMEGTCTR
jgi:hypothetical protein